MMVLTVHELDPDADAIIVLKNPGAFFAIWQEPSIRPPVPSPPSNCEVPKNVWTPGVPDPDRADSPVPVVEELSSYPEETPADPDEHDSREGNGANPRETPCEEGSAIEPSLPASDLPTEKEYHYLVSSRHLTLASGQIKSRLMKGGWKESQPEGHDGKYYLEAQDWDPEAFLILLRILHLQLRAVPRELTLEMLAKLAVLVDYYRCPEALEFISEIWITAAKASSPVPDSYCRDLVLWMLIAWVFKLPEIFTRTTKIAIREATTPTIQDMELPIPNPVLNEMEHKRYQAIEEIISTLHSWLEKFRATSYSCPSGSQYSFACSCMLLGALTKELDRIQCTNPRPEVPFAGISFEQLITDVTSMTSPPWPSDTIHRRYYDGGYYTPHECNFENNIIRDTNELSRKLIGLDLLKFHDRAYEGKDIAVAGWRRRVP